MGALPEKLVAELQTTLGLRRAVETGTFQGKGTRKLSNIFPSVVTIELSELWFEQTKHELADRDNIQFVLGDSRRALQEFVRSDTATLYFLDGHWCGDNVSAGAESNCPLMDELSTLAAGHPDDCIVIDDVRYFLASPPPPFRPGDWPSLADVVDALRAAHPSHHVTIYGEQICSVPLQVRPILDRFVLAYGEAVFRRPPLRRAARALLGSRLLPSSPTRRVLGQFRQRGVAYRRR